MLLLTWKDLMRCLSFVLILGLMIPAPAVAQTTPEAAAQSFGTALTTGDWPGAARLMHPQALGQLRDLFSSVVASPQGTELATQFFGVSSAAEFGTTPDTVLFARFLKNVTSATGMADALKGAQITALGHVTLPGDTVLVVSRMTMSVQGITISSFELMPFVQLNGAYRGMLKADFTNMAAMLKARLTSGG